MKCPTCFIVFPPAARLLLDQVCPPPKYLLLMRSIWIRDSPPGAAELVGEPVRWPAANGLTPLSSRAGSHRLGARRDRFGAMVAAFIEETDMLSLVSRHGLRWGGPGKGLVELRDRHAQRCAAPSASLPNGGMPGLRSGGW